MSEAPLPPLYHSVSVMLFVDGENLAIRYKKMLNGKVPESHIVHVPDILVWSKLLNLGRHGWCDVIRKHYYTCSTGDDVALNSNSILHKEAGIEAPLVFKKEKNRPGKQVDISLTTDMLSHAFRKNYDIAVLVAGDEDYVPLVKAVMSEGRRVVVWFVSDGLSPKLVSAADHFFKLDFVLFNTLDVSASVMMG
jgi:hypothetical protein